MKSSSLVQAAAAVAVLLWSGCASPMGRFADPDLPIDVLRGQSFEIVLESNPTTGYAWGLAKRVENHMINLVKNEYRANETSLVGSGGAEVWTFVGRHEGTTTITFAYRRPWEKETPPSMIRVFRVSIRKG